MTIGERIKLRREELGMSQEELAKRIGYTSRSTINKIEKNENNLRQGKILEIAKALSTTPSYIMGWDDVEFKTSSSSIKLNNNKITITFQSEVDRKYYDKIYKLLTDTSKRKILSKFIDSLMEDD